jgi:hypothetical protein
VDVAFGLLVEESITLLRVGVRQTGGSSQASHPGSSPEVRDAAYARARDKPLLELPEATAPLPYLVHEAEDDGKSAVAAADTASRSSHPGLRAK